MIDFIKNLKGGTFGIYCATMTEKKMNKGGRSGIAPNPLFGKVFTLALYQNTITGCNYRNLVKSECIREGIDVSNFDKDFPPSETYAFTNDNKIFTKKDGTAQYFRLYLSNGRERSKVKYETVVLDNGTYRKPTEEEERIIKSYTPAKSESKKQEVLGISNIVEVRNITISNILFIKQGDKEVKRDGNVSIPTDLKSIFIK